MKIPLPELGLDCEKMSNANDYSPEDYSYTSGYNTRTVENEKSVLVIDEEKMAEIILLGYSDLISVRMEKAIIKELSQNAKQFIRIEKG